MPNLILGLPGREQSELSKLEQRILRERVETIRAHTLVQLSPVPQTPRQISEFLDEMSNHACAIVLVPKNEKAPEHVFGMLLANDICVLRVTNKLELLTKFVGGYGHFDFADTTVNLRSLATVRA